MKKIYLLFVTVLLTTLLNSQFVENKGQIYDESGEFRTDVHFVSQFSGVNLYFTDHGVVHHYRQITPSKYNQIRSGKIENPYNNEEWEQILFEGSKKGGEKKEIFQDKGKQYRVDVTFPGARLDNPIGEKLQLQKDQYFLPQNKDAIKDISHFGRIRYKNAYPGIDLVFYEKEGGLKYDFEVSAKGNPKLIKILYKGHQNIRIDDKGNIVVKVLPGEIIEHAPISYQENENIKSHFKLSNDTILIVLEKYNTNKSITIDPALTWSTYFHDGSTSSASSNSRPVWDPSGNMYQALTTYNNTTYPLVNPGGSAYYNISPGSSGPQLVIQKYNANRQIIWATYYPADRSSNCAYSNQAITIDNSNNIYVIGDVGISGSSSFQLYNPGGGAYYETTVANGRDFILKFSSSGQRLWATMFCTTVASSSGLDLSGLAIDNTNRLIITGGSYDWDPMPTANPGGSHYYSATLVENRAPTLHRFSSAGALQWSTYISRGTAASFCANNNAAVALDPSGNIFLASDAGPTTYTLANPGGGAYQVSTAPSGRKLSIFKFASNGSLNWNTLYGGNTSANAIHWQDSRDITINSTGDVYVVGRSNCTDFPTFDPGGGAYMKTTLSTGSTAVYDGVILKFSNGGVRRWATYCGGNGASDGTDFVGVAIDGSDNITIAGLSRTTNTFPVLNQAGSYYQATQSASYATVLAQFNSNGVQQWGTYYGHQSWASSGGFGGDGAGKYVLFGASDSIPYVNPGGGAYYQAAHELTATRSDFIAEFSSCIAETNTTPTTAICENATKALTSSGAGGGTWSIQSGGGTIIAGPTYDPADISVVTAVTIRYTDGCGTTSDSTFNVNPLPATPATPTGPATVCSGAAITGYGVVAVAGATSYQWSYSGTGTVTPTGAPSGITATLNATVGGNLTVRAVNACGNSAYSSTLAVSINNAPGAPATPTGPAAVCSGVATTGYGVGVVAGATSYQWVYSGTGTVTPTGAPSGITATLNATIGGNLTVRSVNACGNSAYSSALAITVNSAPATPATPTGPNAVCTSTLTTGYGVTAVAGATSYQWSYGGTGTVTPTGAPSGITASLNATTGGNLTVRAVNSCGNSAYSTALVITVDAAAPSAPGAPTGPSAVCTSTLTAGYGIGAVAGATSYQWSYSGTGTVTPTGSPSGITATLNATVGGNLTVRAVNSCGNSAYGSALAVTIDGAIPSTPATPTGPSAVCSSVITTGYGVVAIAGATSYQWSYSGTGTVTPTGSPSGITASLTATVGGNLTVRSVNACGNSAYSSALAVTVDAATPATPGVITGSATVCRGSSSGYSILAVANATSYSWSYSGTGTASSSTASVTFSPTTNGILSVTASNSCGTSAARTLGLTIDTTFTPSIISSGFDMCTGDSRTLVGSPVGGTFSVISGGAFGSVLGNTLAGNAVGTVQVRYRITNACGNMDATQNINIVSPAVASITSSTAAMCIGDLRGLTATPLGGSFSVISGPGYIGLNDTLTPISSGTVQIQYQYISPCGVTADTVSITVNPTPIVTITSPSSDMCIGGTRVLTGTPVAGTWIVLSGPGSILGSTLTTSGAGVIQVEYNASALGCPGTTTQSINVVGSSDATWTPPSNLCENLGLVDLTSYLPGTSTPGGVWSGSPNVSSGGILNTVGLGLTTINIKYKVGTSPCKDSSTMSIFIDTLPDATWNMPSTICESQQFDLDTLLSVGASPGSWMILSGGGALVGSVYTPADVVANTPTSIRYSTFTNGGCPSVNKDEFFTVNVEEIAVNTTTTTAICESGTKTLVGSPLGGTWTVVSGGGGISGTTYTPANVTANTPVVVRYTIAANGGCPATTADVSFNVNVEEIANNTTTTNDICESGTKILVGSPIGGTWSVVSGGGTILGTTYTPANLVANDTTVTVRYTIAANGGCIATTSDAVFNVNLEEIAVNTTTTTDICESTTKALVGSPLGGTWSIISGGGTILGNTYTPANVTANTPVVVRYTIGANGGCPATTADVSFTVNVEEIANNTTTTTDICESTTKALVGSPLGGTWSIVSGGGTILGSTYTPANLVANDTVVTVRYTIAANGGCIATTSDAVFNVNLEEIAVNTTTNTGICESGTKALVGSPLGGTWSVVSGGGTILGSTYTPANINANTLVTVRYTIPTNGGCSASTSDVSFDVFTDLGIAVNTTTTDTICENSTKALSATPIGGTWSIVSGGGTITGATYTPGAIVADVNVTVRYTMPINGSCPATTSDITFTVNADVPAAVNTTTTDAICSSDTKTLVGSPLGGTWSIVSGSGSILGTTYTPAAVVSPVNVTVRYEFTNGKCNSYQDITFTVNNVSATPVIAPVVNDSVCINELVTLNATVGGVGNSVYWFTNNTASGIPVAIGNVLTANPTANVTYYAFGFSGQLCQSTSYSSVNIYTYSPSIAATSIAATLDTVCSGQSTTLTLSGGSLGKNAVWRWYETSCGGTSIGTGTSVMVSPTGSESYFVRAEGLCDTTSCRQFNVVVQNSVDASWTAPDSICLDAGLINLNLYLAPTSTKGGIWSGTGVTDSLFDPQVNGLGSVTITYTVGSSPCIDIQSQAITIYNALPASISDDYLSVTTGNTDTLTVEDNDVTSGVITISMLAQHGVAYVTNNRIVYVADSNYRGYDTLEYSVCDNSCSNTCDTAQIIIRLEKNVFDNPDNGNIGLWGVSPNQDGINDVLYIDDLYNHPNNKITIYNRWGDEIFTSSPYVNDWDGKNYTDGHYFFVLEFLDTKESFKGIIYLKK